MAQCRICFEEDDNLICPCKCNGSIKYIHNSCLNTIIEYKRNMMCEICKTKYNINKPLIDKLYLVLNAQKYKKLFLEYLIQYIIIFLTNINYIEFIIFHFQNGSISLNWTEILKTFLITLLQIYTYNFYVSIYITFMILKNLKNINNDIISIIILILIYNINNKIYFILLSQILNLFYNLYLDV